MDMAILLHQINYVLDHHGKLYGEMADHLGPEKLLGVFAETNVNSFGRAMAYLTLVYLMDIPEDVKREVGVQRNRYCKIRLEPELTGTDEKFQPELTL